MTVKKKYNAHDENNKFKFDQLRFRIKNYFKISTNRSPTKPGIA